MCAIGVDSDSTQIFIMSYCQISPVGNGNTGTTTYFQLLRVELVSGKNPKLLASSLLHTIEHSVSTIDGKLTSLKDKLYACLTIWDENQNKQTNLVARIDQDLASSNKKIVDDLILGLGSLIDEENQEEKIMLFTADGTTMIDSIAHNFTDGINPERSLVMGNLNQSSFVVLGQNSRFGSQSKAQVQPEILGSIETYNKLQAYFELYIKDENKDKAIHDLKK